MAYFRRLSTNSLVALDSVCVIVFKIRPFLRANEVLLGRGGTVYFQHVPTDAVFINYFAITIVEFNLQTGRPVCMSFTLEGRG